MVCSSKHREPQTPPTRRAEGTGGQKETCRAVQRGARRCVVGAHVCSKSREAGRTETTARSADVCQAGGGQDREAPMQPGRSGNRAAGQAGVLHALPSPQSGEPLNSWQPGGCACLALERPQSLLTLMPASPR